MAKIVALSGAQGAGKSTLLNELEKRGWEVDPFKVSRAVQQELGLESLSGIMSSWHSMIQFQEEVYRQKLKRDLSLVEQDTSKIILTERSFADVQAYTINWVWQLYDDKKVDFSTATAWLSDYSALCYQAQDECYDAVIALPYMPHVQWQADLNRADRASAETIYDAIETFVRQKQFAYMPRLKITEGSIEARAEQADKFLRTL